MPPRRTSRFAAVTAACALLTSCASAATQDTLPVLDGVGRIPGAAGAPGAVIVDGVRANLAVLEGAALGANSAGNRLLVIGDSILAGTASRYGGSMCSALVPLGWRVAVEAEPSRPIGFGREVLRKRIYEGWDAAVVFLGTNYGGIAERYAADLARIVESLAPRPTLLVTATVHKPNIQEVNTEIRLSASRNPSVSVLDWSTASVQNGLLNDDGVHPNARGQAVLVASVAAAVGRAPGTGGGACLSSLFTDDSAVTGGEVLPSTTVDPAVTTTTGAPSSTTLAPPVTTTTTVATTSTTVG